jgi:hypothetical protein
MDRPKSSGCGDVQTKIIRLKIIWKNHQAKNWWWTDQNNQVENHLKNHQDQALVMDRPKSSVSKPSRETSSGIRFRHW